MRMQRRAIVAIGAVLVAAVVAGVFLWREGNSAGTSASGDRALVTGYTSSTMFAQSGPVSVVLHGASAARIDQIISGLPVNTAPICAENIAMYEIAFTAVAGPARRVDVVGYVGGSMVEVTVDGKETTRYDGKCALDTAVRRVLPAVATATKRKVTCADW